MFSVFFVFRNFIYYLILNNLNIEWLFQIKNSSFTNYNLLGITNTTFDFQTKLVFIKKRIVLIIYKNTHFCSEWE